MNQENPVPPGPQRDPATNHARNYDDLGEHNGKFRFRFGPKAEAIVKQFEIAAFGRRPVDFLMRTLLFASLSRDRRMWIWRQLCKHRPPWMFVDTRKLPEKQRRQIVRQRSLHLLHVARLLDFRACAKGPVKRTINRLVNCWPVGSQVRWRPKNRRAPRGACRLPHHCPFCFARRVALLYNELRRALPSDSGKRGFYLAVATLADRDPSLPKSRAKQLRWVRQKALVAMRKWLESLGGHGGVTTVQVLPLRQGSLQWERHESVQNSHDGFAYRLAVCAEFDPRPDVLANLSAMHDAPIVSVDGVDLHVRLAVLNHLSDTTLRILLAGHERKFAGEQFLRDDEGLFVWPSLTLCNYAQWRKRLRLLSGQRLFDRWGSWRGMKSTRAQPSLPFGPPASPGKRRRRQKLLHRNQQSQQVADDRIDAILREHGSELRQAQVRAGRPLGRTAIQQALIERGVSVSDRDSRRLAKALIQENDE